MRGIDAPEAIVPITAHPAFAKVRRRTCILGVARLFACMLWLPSRCVVCAHQETAHAFAGLRAVWHRAAAGQHRPADRPRGRCRCAAPTWPQHQLRGLLAVAACCWAAASRLLPLCAMRRVVGQLQCVCFLCVRCGVLLSSCIASASSVCDAACCWAASVRLLPLCAMRRVVQG